MPKTRPVSDLRDHFTETVQEVQSYKAPVFFTQDGVRTLVLMSMECYEAGQFQWEAQPHPLEEPVTQREIQPRQGEETASPQAAGPEDASEASVEAPTVRTAKKGGGMSLSTTKTVQIALICVAVLAFVLGIFSVYDFIVTAACGVAAVAGIADLIIWGLFWRCPYCGEHLGRFGSMGSMGGYCPHCGEKLEID